MRNLLIITIFLNLPSVAMAYHGNTRDSYREYSRHEKIVTPPEMEEVFAPDNSPQADSLDKRIMDTLRLTCGEGIVGNVTRMATGSFKVDCD
ncbi:MAG: hypothetical protein RIS84_1536 [Pseudomonadota bacterium]|jgi:hypothetical protein